MIEWIDILLLSAPTHTINEKMIRVDQNDGVADVKSILFVNAAEKLSI